MANMVKFWKGLKAKYTALATKDAATLYFVTDTQELYLGTTLIADATLDDIAKLDASFANVGELVKVSLTEVDGVITALTVDDSALDNKFNDYVTNEVYNAHLTTQDTRDDGQDELIAGLRADLNEITEVGGEPNKVDDVQVNGATIVADKIANLAVDGAYGNDNKIATVATIDGKIDGLGLGTMSKENAADYSKKTVADGLYAAKGYEGKVDTLIGDDANTSVRTIAADEVAKIVANADEDFDTLKEVADWIANDTEGAAAMQNAIAALKKEIGGTQGAEGFENSRIDAIEAKLPDGIIADTDDITAAIDGLGDLATKDETDLDLKALAHKDTVETTDIEDQSVTGAKIEDGTIGTTKLDAVALKMVQEGAAAYAWGDHSAAGYATGDQLRGVDEAKADKVSGATAGNFAGLDANGNLTDSGKKADDFATAAQGALADTAVQPEDIANSITVGADSGGEANYQDTTITAQGIVFATHENGVSENTLTIANPVPQGSGEHYTLNVPYVNGTLATTDDATNAAKAVQGSTNATIEDCVKAINTMNNDTAKNSAEIVEVTANVQNIVEMLTWIEG